MTNSKQSMCGYRVGQAGFTLIELMITVVVIAILAAIALPAYKDYATKSRRADGRSALSALAAAQERYRSKCPQYASSNASSCGVDLNLDGDTIDANETIPFTVGLTASGAGYVSRDGYYTVTIDAASATGWSAHVTPQGAQAGDTACDSAAEFGVTQAGPTETNAAQRTCWGK